MNTVKRHIKKVMAGIVALLMVGSIAFAGLAQSSPVSAAALAQTTPNTPTTNPSQSGTPGAGSTRADFSQYAAAFLKAFAGKLGVDETKLKDAYTSAANDTIDQAVKDGKLTQDQATKIKDQIKNGPALENPFEGGHGGFGKGFQDGRGAKGGFDRVNLDAVSSALGITTDQLKTELQGGKSIADVAKAHNVDLAKVKTAVLAAIKSNLDQAVKDGKMTQAQADTAYTAATSRIDQMLSNAGPVGGPGNRHHQGKGTTPNTNTPSTPKTTTN